jgi:hypothetical protein
MYKLLLLAMLVVAGSSANAQLQWVISADGSHHVEQTKAYSVIVVVGSGIANGTYSVYGHWSWSGQGTVGSGTATSDALMGQFSVVNGSSTTNSLNWIQGVDQMNSQMVSGHGPTSNLSASSGTWTGNLVMTYTAVKDAGGVTHPFVPLVVTDGYSVQFASSNSPSVPSNPAGGSLTLTVGGSSNAIQFPVDLLSYDTTRTHEVDLLVNNIQVLSWPVPKSLAGQAVRVGNTQEFTCQPGDTVQFRVDGVLLGTDAGQVTLAAAQAGYWTPFQYVWGSPPVAPQTGNSGQTNTGNTTSTTDTGGGGTSTTAPQTAPAQPAAPVTAVNNGNTTIGGGTSGATNQDIYNDVLQALKDAGNASTVATTSSFSPGLVVGSQPSGVGGGQGTQLQTDATSAISQWQTANSSGQSLISSFGPGGARTLQLPSASGLGTSYTYQLSTMHIGSQALNLTLDLTRYQSIISGFRLCGAFFLGVTGFFAGIKIIRSGVA